jgi:hypothetical protein
LWKRLGGESLEILGMMKIVDWLVEKQINIDKEASNESLTSFSLDPRIGNVTAFANTSRTSDYAEVPATPITSL